MTNKEEEGRMKKKEEEGRRIWGRRGRIGRR